MVNFKADTVNGNWTIHKAHQRMWFVEWAIVKTGVGDGNDFNKYYIFVCVINVEINTKMNWAKRQQQDANLYSMAKAYGTSGDDDDGIGFTFKLNQIINALNGVSYVFPYHVLI